jgi:hypothetical protein
MSEYHDREENPKFYASFSQFIGISPKLFFLNIICTGDRQKTAPRCIKKNSDGLPETK